MTRARLSRTFWIGAAAILVVAALIALAAIVKGDFSETDGRILLTLAALPYAGGAALAGLALADRGTVRPLGLAMATAAPVCLALNVWGIWSFALDGESNTPSKLAWSGVIVLAAGLIATTSLLLTRRSYFCASPRLRAGRPRSLRRSALSASGSSPTTTPSSRHSPCSGSWRRSPTSSFPSCSGSLQPVLCPTM